MDKNYYEILGITDEEKKLHGSDFQDILKKKFKKLSLKWHPDRWATGTDEEKKTAEEKFKDINEAKSVLEDESKRNAYDNGGINPDDFGDFSGFNPFDMFRQRRTARGSDIDVTVNITFREAYEGCSKTISVPHEKPCSHCDGTGSEDKKTTTCPHCNGTGMYTESSRRGNMFFQQMHPCPHCNGTGVINPNPCKQCNGTGKEYDYAEMPINIPAGVENGLVMSAAGLGNSIPNGINGNLNIHIVVENDPYFKQVYRNDNINLLHIEEMPFNEAILGKEIEVRLPNGETEKITIKECTEDGKFYILKGKGFPSPSNQQIRGDYAVVIKYKLPKSLTEEQKNKLKNF